MKKYLCILMALIVLLTLAACDTSGEENCDIEKDSNGNIISKVYHDDDGNIIQENILTYYDSGAKHTERIDHHHAYCGLNLVAVCTEELEWSEDGLVENLVQYNHEGQTVYERTYKYYANETENWHKDFDAQTWQYQKSISYDGSGDNGHVVEYEYLDNYTYVDRMYRTDEEGGGLSNETVYAFNEERSAWVDMIRSTYYDYEGRISELYEYNVDGYDIKLSVYSYEDGSHNYFEWYDTEPLHKLQQYAVSADNGKLIAHTVSNSEWDLDWGFVNGNLQICENDADGVNQITTLYSMADGSVISIEDADK